MEIILCINNAFTKKFRYHVIPKDPQELLNFADKIGIPCYTSDPHEFADFAVMFLEDPGLEVWVDNMDLSNDPWDDAKILRWRHYGDK